MFRVHTCSSLTLSQGGARGHLTSSWGMQPLAHECLVVFNLVSVSVAYKLTLRKPKEFEKKCHQLKSMSERPRTIKKWLGPSASGQQDPASDWCTDMNHTYFLPLSSSVQLNYIHQRAFF